MSARIKTARPSVSLIIPAYNEEDYLPACLDAVMRNIADKAIEIIVVDNNSTDGTREVIERYPEVTYLFEPRKGVTRARQCGFRGSQGEILAYIDADTLPPSGWIEQIWEQFDRQEDLACLSGPYTFYDLRGLRRAVSNGWFVAARSICSITGYIVIGGNFAIRRSALERMGGFDCSIEFYGEDVDIAKRASRQGKVRFSPQFLMPTSGRRMQRDGFLRMAGIYFINYFSIVFHGKPVTQTYTDVR